MTLEDNKDISTIDREYIVLCLNLLESISAPIYSHFRVVALISYMDLEDKLRYVLGTNAESTFIGGSICAERVCVNKLRESKFKSIEKIYLVSDDLEYITPGDLCREFLIDQLPDSTKILMWGKNSYKTSTLIELYPYPPLYRGINSNFLENHARNLSMKMNKVNHKEDFFVLYNRTIELTYKDKNKQYSPIRLAAGVEFDNGTIEVIWQDKLIEYGTTTDPVARLVVLLQLNRDKGILPRYIIQTDQYGVMHAPFAEGRANLYENDFKQLSIIIHDQEGNIKRTNSLELSPEKLK